MSYCMRVEKCDTLTFASAIPHCAAHLPSTLQVVSILLLILLLKVEACACAGNMKSKPRLSVLQSLPKLRWVLQRGLRGVNCTGTTAASLSRLP